MFSQLFADNERSGFRAPTSGYKMEFCFSSNGNVGEFTARVFLGSFVFVWRHTFPDTLDKHHGNNNLHRFSVTNLLLFLWKVFSGSFVRNELIHRWLESESGEFMRMLQMYNVVIFRWHVCLMDSPIISEEERIIMMLVTCLTTASKECLADDETKFW